MYTLAFLFAFAVLAKLRSKDGLETDIARYQLLPARWTAPAALAVTAAEVTAAILLLLGGRFATFGFALALALLLTFCGALVSALRRGLRIPCGCFGSSAKPIGRLDLVRNLGFLACAAAGLATGGGRATSPPAAEAAVVAAVAVLSSLLWIHLDQLHQLFTGSGAESPWTSG